MGAFSLMTYELQYMVSPSSVLLLTACFSFAVAGQHDIYSRYSVHRVSVRTAADVELLRSLEHALDLDVWEHGAPPDRDEIVMVSPEHAPRLLQALNDNGVAHSTHRADVAKMLEEYDAQLAAWRSQRGAKLTPFENFPRHAEVNEYLESIAAQYPDLVTLVNAAPSFEGREIKYLKISTTNFTDPSKPIYFLDTMIHAREWVTTPTALFAIHRLVVELRAEDRDLREDVDWIILPVVNPDGYEYTHTNMRLWRKTRSFNANISTTCYGVDGNRNYDAFYGQVGVSFNPCADTYLGTEAFSEVETRNVRDLILEHLDRLQIFVDIHSHGNWVLFTYGDGSLPNNTVQIFHVGSAMGAAMDAHKLPQAPYYRVGNSAILLYPASGGADDYAQLAGVPFSFTLELPGYNYWFQVPPQYIDQINAETWEGIAASARLARSYYRARL